MDNSIKNKVAFVTGAALGIGRETAILLAKKGAKVMVTDINVEEGNNTASIINDAGGYEEWRYLARTAVQQRTVLLFDGVETADTRTDGDADALGIGLIYFQAGIGQRLTTRRDTVMDEGIHFLDVFGRDVLRRIESQYRSAEADGKGRHVEGIDGTYATAPGQNIVPGLCNVIADRRNYAQSCNDDAPLRQLSVLFQRYLHPIRSDFQPNLENEKAATTCVVAAWNTGPNRISPNAN